MSTPDMMAHLQALPLGLRGMGIGNPDEGGRIEAAEVVRWAIGEIARLRLADAECEDLRTWQLECWRQAETATEGGNEELAQRWIDRRKRAFALLERHAP